MRALGFLACAVGLGACAPVTWVESDQVVARTIVESPPRRERRADANDATVYVEGDTVRVRLERTGACAVDIAEQITHEHTRRSEPDKTYLVLDQVALYAGAVAAVAGVAYAGACTAHRETPCEPALPLVAGGLGLEVWGAVGLFVDASKRKTTSETRRELRRWEPSVRACARAPLSGVMVSIVPDYGPTLRGVADATGLAVIALNGRRAPFEAEIRIDEQPLRRQRIQ